MLHHGDLAGLVVDLDLGDEGRHGRSRSTGRHLAGLGIDVGERDQEDAAAGDGAALLELGGDRHVLAW